jgi:hypothetical protein
MLYSSLTPSQQEQVHHQFRDDLFEKDPAWFDYRVDGEGNITTRARLPEFAQERSRKRGGLAVRITEITSPRPLTSQQKVLREIAYKVIARHLYQILYLSKGLS